MMTEGTGEKDGGTGIVTETMTGIVTGTGGGGVGVIALITTTGGGDAIVTTDIIGTVDIADTN
jgi:hypothetical protein